MGKLFISHSSKDKVVADALVNRAKALGYDCFLDFQGIRGGAAWEKEIYDAMRQSVAVLVCATPVAMESHWVFAEMLLARYSGIPLIPLIMQTCTLPELIPATTQHIDFTVDPEAGYARLWATLDQLKVTSTRASIIPRIRFGRNGRSVEDTERCSAVSAGPKAYRGSGEERQRHRLGLWRCRRRDRR